MISKKDNIGIVAGDKNLPFKIVEWAKKNNVNLFVVGIKNSVLPTLKKNIKNDNYIELNLSDLSKTIKFFKKNNVKKIVMVGGVNKASVKITFDLIKVFFKLLFMKNKYDAVLRVVISEFEKKNIKVIGIQDLMPELLTENKILTDVLPSSKNIEDINYGFEKALNFASSDKGQSIIVMNKKVIAVESFKGTDELIKRSYEVKNKKSGGILIKVAKPFQEMRADIPVLGEKTIQNLYKYKFDGIIIESGKSIIEDKEKVIKLANKLGIFIIGSNGKLLK